MLAVEGELESSAQEVDKLQTQIADYEEEMREAWESMKELRKQVGKARAQSSANALSEKQLNIDWTRQNKKFSSRVVVFKKWKRITWK